MSLTDRVLVAQRRRQRARDRARRAPCPRRRRRRDGATRSRCSRSSSTIPTPTRPRSWSSATPSAAPTCSPRAPTTCSSSRSSPRCSATRACGSSSRGRREAPRVLVVDDDPSIRQICREVLELGGYQVRDAGSANAALAEARRFRPDMILLDVLMPGIDGYRARRDDPRRPGDRRWRRSCSCRRAATPPTRCARSARGAEDYMVKPFDAAELLARVAQGARSPGPRARRVADHAAPRRRRDPGRDRAPARDGDPTAVACYLDLDNLKAFNDYYGYAKANAVIRQTGDVIRDVVTRTAAPATSSATSPATTSCSSRRADRVDARLPRASASASIT